MPRLGLRQLLLSARLAFGLAAVLLLAALASLFELRLPSRPAGDVADLRGLAARDDVSILFLLVDTLRADHLGAYGYARDTSPILDELASVGVRFARVRAQSSWTKCSMASLWTGAYPAATGVLRHAHALKPGVELPAEIARAAGWATGGIYRNGWVANNFGFDQGFDLYLKPVPSRAPGRVERRTPSAHPLQGTDLDATEAAIEFLRAHRDERFLLYVHYMDVHQYLYEESSALFGTRYEDAYDNAIHWTDRNIGHLLRAADELGLLEKTVVAIASDHGEAFYEHGREGHARDLHAETVSTPLILSLPFRLEAPLVIEPLVRNIDLWPTLLDLVGLPPLAGAEGVSLVPLMQAGLEGRDPAAVAPARAHAQLDQTWGRVEAKPRPLVSVSEGDLRLFYRAHAPDDVELYDSVADPTEQTDLAAARPAEAARLRAVAERYLESAGAGMAQDVELDEMRLEQLRALGYVIGK